MRGLPARCYVDPARAALEFEAIFARHWQFVCHVADLPAAGTAARFDCLGRSAFVLRTSGGGLRAFRNACAHRGSRLIDGDANTGFAFCVDGRVRCPYHGWTYDEAGVLESIPGGRPLATLEPGDQSLQGLAVAEWQGLVFVAFGPPARPLGEALGSVTATWPDATPLRRCGEPRSLPVEADWKLACEHLLDADHWDLTRPAARRRLFAPLRYAVAGPDALAATAALDDEAKMAWPARAYAQLLARRAGDPCARAIFLWPNLCVTATPDGLTVTQVQPGAAAGRCTLRVLRYVTVDVAREMRALRYLHDRVMRRAWHDDARLLARLQQGLASADPAHTAPLGASESALAWFAERCSGSDAASAPVRPPRRTLRRKTVAVAAP
ncbi:MAG: aromatic ring-hydroxylating oxygenase subunit alpha [Steroidobacteraceae bacterium]